MPIDNSKNNGKTKKNIPFKKRSFGPKPEKKQSLFFRRFGAALIIFFVCLALSCDT